MSELSSSHVLGTGINIDCVWRKRIPRDEDRGISETGGADEIWSVNTRKQLR